MTNNWKKGIDSGNDISRRKFLDMSAKWAAWIILSTSVLWALAANFEQDKKSADNWKQKDTHNDNPEINKEDDSHEEAEHNKNQIYIDHAATGLFLWYILPQFMKNEPEKALGAGVMGIAGWLSVSDDVSRHHFWEEMKDASIWVGTMVAILQATEAIQVNYKKAMNKYLFDTQEKVIDHILQDDDVEKVLKKLNIQIDKDLEYPVSVHSDTQVNGNKQNWGFDYTHIAISINKFSELLPLLVTNIEHFKNAILRSIAHEDYHKQAKIILEKNWKLDSSLIEWMKEVKEDVLINEKELIKWRVVFLTQFIFLTQIPLFGVWQAWILKNEIKSISNSVKNLFKSAWYLQTDAARFATQVEAKLTSFLFNRFAYASDIGPMTASGQIGSQYKNSLKWVWKLVEWMIPVAIANIKPLFIELDEIFDNVVPWQKKSLKQQVKWFPEDISDFLWKTFSNIKDTVWALNESKFTATGNQAYLNNRVISKEIHKIDPHMKLPFSYEDARVHLKDIRHFFDSYPKLSVNPVSINIWENTFGLYGILFYMERLMQSKEFECYTEVQKRKTRERINKILLHRSFDFTRVQKALHFLEHDSGNAKRLWNFLDQYLPSVDYMVLNHDDLFEKITSLALQDTSRESYDAWLDWSIVSLPQHILASNTAIVDTLKKNIWYLWYLQIYHPEFGQVAKETFKDNVIQQTKVKALLPILSKVFSVKEIQEWNGIFDNTEYIIKEGGKSTLDIENSVSSEIREQHWFQKIMETYKKHAHNTFHKWEKLIWVNSWEVILMVLLIQSPYVTAVVSTVNHWLEKMPKDLNPTVKKYIIWFITYFLSMFADNYVWEIVGHKLIMQNFPDMDPFDAIRFVGPLAVLGGSQVITGNSPNAVIGTVQKMYGSSFNISGKDKDMLESSEFKKRTTFLWEVMFDVVSVGTLAEDPLSIEWWLSAIAQVVRPKFFWQ